MSRRFWIGTPKGQNTTADTFFDTSRQTIYQVNTSAPTTYPSFFDTFYNTAVPTDYIISTTYDAITNYVTNYFYGVITSHPTADIRDTLYYYPGEQTSYIVSTTVTRPTYIGYYVPTGYSVTEDVYRPTSIDAPYSGITLYTDIRITQYSNPTNYPGFFYPATTTFPTDYTYSSNAYGCYYFNADGSPAGQDGVPPGCSIVGCDPPSYNYANGSAPTYFDTCLTTAGSTTYLTHIYVGQNTTSTVIFNGQSAPDIGVFDCYPDDSPDVIAFCQDPQNRCEPCQGYYQTTYETDVGYDQVTSYPAPITTCYATSSLTSVSYLQSECYNCSVDCVASVNTTSSYQAYQAPYSGITYYDVATIVGYTPVSTIYPYISYYDTYIGTTTYTAFRDTIYVTSPPTTYQQDTEYTRPTNDYFYPVPTEYTRVTTYETAYPTSNPTSKITQYPTDVATTIDTATPTSNQTSVDTTVITSWLTDNDVTTTYQTSRSTTWFTQ